MNYRIRPTALIMRGDQVLLIEYEEDGKLHYNFPGGGLEPGETLVDGVLREVWEEAHVRVTVGPIAFVHEFHPDKQSGDYGPETPPTLSIFFECTLAEGNEPRLPEKPDPLQSGVRWIPLNKLHDIVLYPNIKKQVVHYAKTRRTIDLIEDVMLERNDGIESL